MRLQLTIACVAMASSGVAAQAEADDGPWRFAADTLLYSDSDNVTVVSPQLGVHHRLDDEGGEVGATVVVDAISAASVDVVSQATRRFDEVRTEGDLGVSKAFGRWLPAIGYRYSHEPDYESHQMRLGIARSLAGRDAHVGLGATLSVDDVGMSGTPRDAFSESLHVYTADASYTQTLGPRTLLRGVYTLTAMDGYMEKPYRQVPLFDDAGTAAAMDDGVELDLDTFDRYRLPLRPPEEVPDRRLGHALSLRLLRYVPALGGSVRLDYQLYGDSWGVIAHVLEPNVHWQLHRQLALSGYSRLYIQSAARFWQRVYVVSEPDAVPRWRTVDRDLSPFQTATGGLRLNWKLGPFAAYLDGSAMYTRYEDYLFLDDRLALIGQAGLRWTP